VHHQLGFDAEMLDINSCVIPAMRRAAAALPGRPFVCASRIGAIEAAPYEL
jgi:hypothetical protein